MFKLVLSIIGFVGGGLVAYALRPSHWGQRPSLTEMIEISEFQSGLFIYAGGGALLGLLLGMAIDTMIERNKRGDDR